LIARCVHDIIDKMTHQPMNTCIRFVKPVTGAVTPDHFERVQEPVASVGKGQLLVQVVHLPMDPSQRAK